MCFETVFSPRKCGNLLSKLRCNQLFSVYHYMSGSNPISLMRLMMVMLRGGICTSWLSYGSFGSGVMTVFSMRSRLIYKVNFSTLPKIWNENDTALIHARQGFSAAPKGLRYFNWEPPPLCT